MSNLRGRVVFVQQNPVFGAVERYIADLAQLLRRAEYERVIICPDVDDMAPFLHLADKEGIEVVAFHSGRTAAGTLRALVTALRKARPDAVHVGEASSLAMIAAQIVPRKRVVVTFHTP
ncbi:MAG: glycosyltransferase family 4 protein, partial [Acidimicrobiales bacterium]